MRQCTMIRICQQLSSNEAELEQHTRKRAKKSKAKQSNAKRSKEKQRRARKDKQDKLHEQTQQ